MQEENLDNTLPVNETAPPAPEGKETAPQTEQTAPQTEQGAPQAEAAEQPAEQTQPQGSVLRSEGLVKIYGKRTVVNDVSFDVRQGEIVGLLGPNGAVRGLWCPMRDVSSLMKKR